MDDAHGDILWPPHGTIPAAVMTNKINTLWAVNLLEERIWVIPRFQLLKLHKIVRSLKLRMYKDEGLYYLYVTKTKALRSCAIAVLHMCFHPYRVLAL